MATLTGIHTGDTLLVGFETVSDFNQAPSISDLNSTPFTPNYQTVVDGSVYEKTGWFNGTVTGNGMDTIMITGFAGSIVGITAYDISNANPKTLTFQNNYQLSQVICDFHYGNCQLGTNFVQGSITLSLTAIVALANCYPSCGMAAWTLSGGYTNDYSYESPPGIDAPEAYLAQSSAHNASDISLLPVVYGQASIDMDLLESAVALGPYTPPIPIVIFSQSGLPSSTYQMLAVNNTVYDVNQLPKTLISNSSVFTYGYFSSVGNYNFASLSGCGQTLKDATFTPSSTCTITAVYVASSPATTTTSNNNMITSALNQIVAYMKWLFPSLIIIFAVLWLGIKLELSPMMILVMESLAMAVVGIAGYLWTGAFTPLWISVVSIIFIAVLLLAGARGGNS